MRKLTVLSAAALIGLGSLASTEAEAQYRRNNSGAVAAGVVGGLAAGALIGAAASNAYSAPAYGYGYAPAPVGYGYGPAPVRYGYGPAPVRYGYEPAPVVTYRTTRVARPAYSTVYDDYEPRRVYRNTRVVRSYEEPRTVYRGTRVVRSYDAPRTVYQGTRVVRGDRYAAQPVYRGQRMVDNYAYGAGDPNSRMPSRAPWQQNRGQTAGGYLR